MPDEQPPLYEEHMARLRAIREKLSDAEDIKAINAALYLFQCIFGRADEIADTEAAADSKAVFEST